MQDSSNFKFYAWLLTPPREAFCILSYTSCGPFLCLRPGGACGFMGGKKPRVSFRRWAAGGLYRHPAKRRGTHKSAELFRIAARDDRTAVSGLAGVLFCAGTVWPVHLERNGSDKGNCHLVYHRRVGGSCSSDHLDGRASAPL